MEDSNLAAIRRQFATLLRGRISHRTLIAAAEQLPPELGIWIQPDGSSTYLVYGTDRVKIAGMGPRRKATFVGDDGSRVPVGHNRARMEWKPIDSDTLEQIARFVEGQADSTLEPTGYTDEKMEARDRWIYENKRENHCTNQRILEDLEKLCVDREWEPITDASGVSRAVNRYVSKTNAKPLPTNRGGRPKAK